MQIGYALSSEEHRPSDLVAHAVAAEQAGFPFALISDHFHPWIDAQGQSPFVWSVLGAIAAGTSQLRVGTGVTCPTIRIHPAIVAQAAATAASLFEGRFFLGVGTGENLNEHILGERWPPTDVRRQMLEEAVDVMRELWRGGLVNHRGTYYHSGKRAAVHAARRALRRLRGCRRHEAAELAAQIGDGIIATEPTEICLPLSTLRVAAGLVTGRSRSVGQVEAAARATALQWWPNAGLRGTLSQELPLPSHFEQAAEMVSEDDIADAVACGPDPAVHLARFGSTSMPASTMSTSTSGAGSTGLFRFYERELHPALESLTARAAS